MIIIIIIIIIIIVIVIVIIKPHIRVLERIFTLNLREREQTRSEQAKFLKLEMAGTGLEPETFYFVNEHSSIYLVHR